MNTPQYTFKRKKRSVNSLIVLKAGKVQAFIPEGHMMGTLTSWPSRRRSILDKRQMLFFLPLWLISSITQRHRPPMTWRKHPVVLPSVAAAVSRSLVFRDTRPAL